MHTSLYDMYDSGEEVIDNSYEIERLTSLDPSELVTMINEEFGSEMSVEYDNYGDIFYVDDIAYNCRYDYDYDRFIAMVEDMLYDLDHETIADLVKKYC